jgi:Na+/proline symporter
MVDFYRPFVKKNRTPGDQLRISRWMTAGWGIILAVLAVGSRGAASVLESALTIVSVSYGGMLGVFLLGVLTKKANEKGSLAGLVGGLIAMLAIWIYTPIAFTWYVLIGTAITFLIGYTASGYFADDSKTAADQAE